MKKLKNTRRITVSKKQPGGKIAVDNLEPLGPYMLCRKIEREKKTESGLFLPDTESGDSDVMPETWLVLKVGSGGIREDGVFREVRIPVGSEIQIKKAYLWATGLKDHFYINEDFAVGRIV